MTGSRLDRVEGALLASACGDALGVPYEFGTASLAATESPRMIGGGLGPYAPGEWSDDTQMAVVIARVAASRGLADEAALDDVVDGWIAWLAAGASDAGIQTRRVLGALADQAGPGSAVRARAAARDLHRRTGRTAGNGSLMRTAPVALAFLDDPVALGERARAVSDLTHPDPVAGDACVLWCHAIRSPSSRGGCRTWRTWSPSCPSSGGTSGRPGSPDADQRPPAAFAPNGYVVHALQAAWSAICHPVAGDPVPDASPVASSLAAAVHAGDDTDTVAAIAGALLGACWGASSLPSPGCGIVHGWPGLDAAGLRDLATPSGGRPLTPDWRGAPRLPVGWSKTAEPTRTEA